MAKQNSKPQPSAPSVIDVAREIYVVTVTSQAGRTTDARHLAERAIDLAETFVDAVAHRELIREIAHDKAKADEESAADELKDADTKPTDSPPTKAE